MRVWFKEKHMKIRRPGLRYLIFLQDAKTNKYQCFLKQMDFRTDAHNRKKRWGYSNYWRSLMSRFSCFFKSSRGVLNFHLMLWSVSSFCFSCRLVSTKQEQTHCIISKHSYHSIILSFLFHCNDLSSVFRAFPSETAGLFIV